MDLNDTQRAFKVPAPVREGEASQATYSGQPGDLVLLRVSLAPAWSFVLSLKGVLHLGTITVDVLLGAVGPGGTLAIPFKGPKLLPGIDASTGFAQPIIRESDGSLRLVAPSSLVFLDASIP